MKKNRAPIHYSHLPATAGGRLVLFLYLEAELRGRGLTLKEFRDFGHDKAAVQVMVKEGILQPGSYVKNKETGQHIRVHRFNIKPLGWHERIYWRTVKWFTARKMTLKKLFLLKRSKSLRMTSRPAK